MNNKNFINERKKYILPNQTLKQANRRQEERSIRLLEFD